MLKSRHQFTVKTAHGVAGEKTGAFPCKMLVDLAQMRHQTTGLCVVLLQQHQLQLLKRENGIQNLND